MLQQGELSRLASRLRLVWEHSSARLARHLCEEHIVQGLLRNVALASALVWQLALEIALPLAMQCVDCVNTVPCDSA